MKRILLLILLLLVAIPSYAGSITATWDANAASDNVLYYTLYIDGSMAVEIINDTIVTVELPVDFGKGSHITTVTATNIDAESLHSDPASFNYGGPGKPQNHKTHR
jgi:hypothetical protein